MCRPIPAIEAMKADNNASCEKPLTLTLAEAKRCLDVARKYQRIMRLRSGVLEWTSPVPSKSFPRSILMLTVAVLPWPLDFRQRGA